VCVCHTEITTVEKGMMREGALPFRFAFSCFGNGFISGVGVWRGGGRIGMVLLFRLGFAPTLTFWDDDERGRTERERHKVAKSRDASTKEKK
jgi:hypothetical protein